VSVSVQERRAERHASVRDQVVAAAWRLAAEKGLTGFGLRDVAASVGMRAPSLYSYFPSKFAIYDAMFADGYRAFRERIATVRPSRSRRVSLVRAAETYLDFCQEDPARHQLLFLRVVPGFEPSPESYAEAVVVLDDMRVLLAGMGLHDRRHLDLWTALTAGLASQQAANDPEGKRWTALVEPAMDMYLSYVEGDLS
jgi:AcrR family transcriptional regulator